MLRKFIIPKIQRLFYIITRLQSLEQRLSDVEEFLHIENTLNSKENNGDYFNLEKASNENIYGEWKRIDNFKGYCRSRGLLSFKGCLYVGFESRAPNSGSVKVYKNQKWYNIELIEEVDEVVSIIEHKNSVWFCSKSLKHGASVWRLENNKADLIQKWPKYLGAFSAISYKNKLYVSLISFEFKDNKSAPIVAYDGKAWKTIIKNHSYSQIYEFHIFKNKLYAATLSYNKWNGHVIEIQTSKKTYKVIGGNDKKSWNKCSVLTRLASDGKQLFVVGNKSLQKRTDNYPFLFAYDKKTWKKSRPLKNVRVGTNIYSYNAVIYFNNKLIIGCGGRPAGNARVYYLNKTGWHQLGGDGVNKSWSSNIFKLKNYAMSKNANTEYVYNLCEHNGCIIAGFGASINSGQVWKFILK